MLPDSPVIGPEFQFSQACLQDFVDCPRRFQLRYLLRVPWPALEAEPADVFERHLKDGEVFHRLVHEHVIGLPEARLSSLAEGYSMHLSRDGIRDWWKNYLDCDPSARLGGRFPEVTLSASLAGCRLVAKYDLIAILPGRSAVIMDWKTAARRPGRPSLARRLQTRVYRYLLVRAGAFLNGGQPLTPEQVQMVYWFAEYPDEPEVFQGDGGQHAADEGYLAGLIEQARGMGGSEFLCTIHEENCRHCRYRSLCDRGSVAAPFAVSEDDFLDSRELGAELDFDQIAEIAF